jgi:hypothetical protein
MSYDYNPALQVSMAHARSDAFEDEVRMEFLRELDAADFEVTEWEAEFLQSIFARAAALKPKPVVFSPRQREKIQQMRQAYQHRL